MTEKVKRRLLQNLEPLHGYRRQRGWTQGELANYLGVTPEYLSRIFRGHSDVSMDLLAHFADKIGCEVYDFVLPPNLAVVPREEKEALERLRFLLHRPRELQTA